MDTFCWRRGSMACWWSLFTVKGLSTGHRLQRVEAREEARVTMKTRGSSNCIMSLVVMLQGRSMHLHAGQAKYYICEALSDLAVSDLGSNMSRPVHIQFFGIWLGYTYSYLIRICYPLAFPCIRDCNLNLTYKIRHSTY